ncbi:MAG: quinolinate synthase NadA [Planctomycetota bacterium]
MLLWQPSLPEKYTKMSPAHLAEQIAARRRELGSDLVILGHHYQQDEVIQHADFTGDSFKLSQLAAEQVEKSNAKYVVFCGVHFMAESADILTPDNVAVILPDLSAGCSMADMAEYDQTQQAWDEIHEALDATDGPSVRLIPITYMNSSAAIKAFVGTHGGAVCTSSNAARVFEWALAGGEQPKADDEEIKLIFLPDQHLGRNTAHAAGFVTEVDAARTGATAETALWDPNEEFGGLDAATIRQTKIFLWKGHCSVHRLFRPEHVAEFREYMPQTKILVHPECMQEVCEQADFVGSTEFILKQIEGSEKGSSWAIGTEVHLVNRLAHEAEKRGVQVQILSGTQCLCTTMYRIDQPHLLWVLDNLAEGKVVNQVAVHPEAQAQAILALNRMLSLTGAGGLPADAGTPPITTTAAGAAGS